MPSRILVVDDDKFVQNVCALTLKQHGYETSTASNGQEALEKISQENFDLVITDLRMPAMDGLELLKRLRELSEASPPVVVISAAGTITTAVEACRLGAVNFIEKPFDNQKLLWCVQDALERQSLRRDLLRYKELDKVKKEFLSIASHELRLPLMNLMGSLEFLEDKTVKKSSVARKLFAIMKRNSRQLFWLTQNLLSVTRDEANKLKCFPKKLLLEPLVKACHEECLFVFTPDKKLHLDLKIPKRFSIYADRHQLYLVFINLISNAFKFSRSKGKITVTAQRQGRDSLLSISDEGIGISPDNQKRIFKRFYQVDETLTREYRGLGIGLSVVKAIIEEHSGHIWVKSRLGKGTSFYFTLPKRDLKT